jgi:hypothetical protein
VRAIAFAILLVFLPQAIGAQELKLPTWEVKKIDGQEFACYDLEDAKTLVQIDLELKFRGERLAVCRINYEETDKALDELLTAAVAESKSLEALKVLLGKKNTEIVKLEQDKASLEKKTIRNNLPWIISSALMIAVVAFASGWLLRAKG